MRELAHSLRVDVGRVTGLLDPGDNALALVFSARDFRGHEFAVERQRHIGERSTDVDADPPVSHLQHPRDAEQRPNAEPHDDERHNRAEGVRYRPVRVLAEEVPLVHRVYQEYRDDRQ